ncbi:GNAT family N-acetyltransferase [Desulfosarcina ovata]|uniref:N-acetyltransferase domain-containing protein n=1 Tax=Desulfosarcina ovata subsp. ovata TaxID=2752305 RepID=A0A5K8A5F1_9BACT|nr:GNAT family N-acetyltransferase [Desulfosarcina ovata]BBO87735.1 hypothetical protein DSCOOX_09150 [Desulfosarcina ovata subsp. ovata]
MDNEKVTIRDMTEEDLAGVLAVDKGIVGTDRVLTYEDPRTSYLGGEMGLSKVAEINGEIVGFAIGGIIAHPYTIEDVGFLNLIGVLPEQQRKGIASNLIKGFMKTCKERKAERLITLVNFNDEQMTSLFRSVGFSQSDVVEFSISTEDME